MSVLRQVDEHDAAHERLRGNIPDILAEMHYTDLSQVDQVCCLVDAILAAAPRKHVLVNNASSIYARQQTAPGGLELTLALNHIRYCGLPALLRERLVTSAPARVVNVALEAHRSVQVDFDEMQSARAYSGWRAYQRSKLANIVFTREFARQFEVTGVHGELLAPRLRRQQLGDMARRHRDRQGGRGDVG